MNDDNFQENLEDLKNEAKKLRDRIERTQLTFKRALPSVILHQWTTPQYDAMLKYGILLETDPVELVNGQIIQMSPINPPHAAATKRSYDYLTSILSGRAAIRSQVPVVLNDNSKPEPDIAVVKPDEREYSDRHPTADDILLIIEISDATLAFDLGDKAKAYALSGVQDYWVVDVRERQVHVLRQPVGEEYVQRKVFKLVDVSSTESMVAFPGIQLFLVNLLPLN